MEQQRTEFLLYGREKLESRMTQKCFPIKWVCWEPKDKSRKNPIRTYWRKNEEKKVDKMEKDPVEWWEEQNAGVHKE